MTRKFNVLALQGMLLTAAVLWCAFPTLAQQGIGDAAQQPATAPPQLPPPQTQTGGSPPSSPQVPSI
jgi:hypothetical protein